MVIKMVIGLDIDDTITNSSELVMEYAKKYFNSTNEDYTNSILHAETIDGELLDFYYKYLLELMKNYTLKENVKDVIDRLKLKGHKIIVITARAYTVQAGLIEITIDYFEKHNIVVDKMIFKSIDKLNACLENKVDIMVDDSISVLNTLKNTNIKTLLFSSVNNKNQETDLIRINSWLELEKYIDNN
jgi:uncharacterized HAD superfamily protein